MLLAPETDNFYLALAESDAHDTQKVLLREMPFTHNPAVYAHDFLTK